MPDPKNDFQLTNGPVVRSAPSDAPKPFDLPDVIDLPPVKGDPLLFAAARDPRTIFAYWNIDWPSVFENTAPVDRQVHLRVYRADGTEETSTAAEPMAGNCYLTVAQPRETYRVEIGYYQPQAQWRSVAQTDPVTMPPERLSENTAVDLATIPFHLTFQRLIDLFRQSNGDALAELVSRLQKRAFTPEETSLLSPEDWAILTAMNLSMEQVAADRESFSERPTPSIMRRRAEAILGFGASSPNGGFGKSSWS